MDYRNLGGSGVKVSSLCLGSLTFGEHDESSMLYEVGCDEKTAFLIMNKAVDSGVNFFDTADVYGPDGLSERIIGRWFEAEHRRDEVVLATKFGFRLAPGPLNAGASRRRIMRCAEDSLRRLRTDRIDLYQVHVQDIETPEEETLRALDDLVRQGKVLYIGASNYAAYRLADSLRIGEVENLARYVTLQARYNLVARELEREHVPLCAARGLGVLPYSPLGGGLLSGKYGPDQAPPPGARVTKWTERYGPKSPLWPQFATERNWRIVDAVQSAANGLGATPAQVSLAWLLRKPQVASVIIGVRSLAQLEDNLKAAETALPDEEMRKLDEASTFELGDPYDFLTEVQGRW